MSVIVVSVVAIVTRVLDGNDIVVAMMGSTVQLWLVSVVAVLVNPGLLDMVARLKLMPWPRIMRHLCDLWVMVSLKLWVGHRMHESLVHFSHSLPVPYLLLCRSSWAWRGHPFVGVPLMTSDEVETLATGLIPGSRASFFDFDAAGKLGPAHLMKGLFSKERVDLGDADE